MRLGDAGHRAARFWLPEQTAARELEAEQLVEVPEVQAASLREVASAEPTAVPAAQPLALAVRYQWTVVPPRVPAGAGDDALVVRWKKLDQDWATRVGQVRAQLQAAEGDRGRISRAFTRLGGLLGFGRTHERLHERVESLAKERPSDVGPSGASALLDQLTEVEETTRQLETDLQDAERKAQEDEEREKQQTEWEARVHEAKRALPERRAALAEVEGRRAQLEVELREIEVALQAADKQTKKDLMVARGKRADGLQRAEKELGRLRGEITALEHRAEEVFEYRPRPAAKSRPTKTGATFVPAPSAPRAAAVPSEALPEVGSLQSHKGQRYLVIQTWEQLEAGEKAAARLNAKLVAPEKA